ncbi:MAG: DUF1284 domain-containing protein [Alistipes sp.]|nr:DUF1284 domain-containing protein [Alistipes sp.]
MNLRPHHLLCIQKFTGHGYNESFTVHMKSIVSELTDEPMTPITLTRGCDDLCQVCPNNMNDACNSLEKVAIMDDDVLRNCKLAYGEDFPWKYLSAKARKQIFETDEFNKICSCCQWFELCRSTEGYYDE